MILGAHHVGISVSNLECSIDFYHRLLGMDLVVSTPFSGDRIEKITGLSGASGRVALLRRNSLQIELFEFDHPAPKAPPATRSVSDHGISHFCIEVTDIYEEYTRLKAAGVRFHCPPQPGPTIATYGCDPDGNVFELLEITERDAAARTSR